MSLQQLRTSLSKISILVASVFLFTVIFAAPIAAHAEYDCGTYSAGDYNDDHCDEATTETTPNSSASANSNNASTNSGATSDSSTRTPASAPEDVTQQSTIILNDYNEYSSGQQKTLELNVGQVVHFYVRVVSESHSITIKSMTDQTLVVTIASTPHDVTVQKGQTVSDDVDGDGVNDIAVTYKGLTGSVGTIGFASLTYNSAMPILDGENTPVVHNGWTVWVGAGVIVIAVVTAVIVVRKRHNA